MISGILFWFPSFVWQHMRSFLSFLIVLSLSPFPLSWIKEVLMPGGSVYRMMTSAGPSTGQALVPAEDSRGVVGMQISWELLWDLQGFLSQLFLTPWKEVRAAYVSKYLWELRRFSSVVFLAEYLSCFLGECLEKKNKDKNNISKTTIASRESI